MEEASRDRVARGRDGSPPGRERSRRGPPATRVCAWTAIYTYLKPAHERPDLPSHRPYSLGSGVVPPAGDIPGPARPDARRRDRTPPGRRRLSQFLAGRPDGVARGLPARTPRARTGPQGVGQDEPAAGWALVRAPRRVDPLR